MHHLVFGRFFLKSAMNFIVAAPHSFCDADKSERHCDRVAALAVCEIEKYDAGRYIRYIQTSDKLRTEEHDYNRPNTDLTSWREDLRKQIKTINPDFVFEMHSFPGKHEMYRRLWPGADLAIFESKHNSTWVHWLANEIKTRVPNGYVISVVKPWHPVAITDDVIKIRNIEPDRRKIFHSLFEFNEDMPPERVTILARAVYDAVVNLIEQDIMNPGGIAMVISTYGGNHNGTAGFDGSIIHPASISPYGSKQKNTRELAGLAAVFLILSIVLIGVGRAVGNRAYKAMFPQLHGWAEYTTGDPYYDQNTNKNFGERITRAWEYAKRNPL